MTENKRVVFRHPKIIVLIIEENHFVFLRGGGYPLPRRKNVLGLKFKKRIFWTQAPMPTQNENENAGPVGPVAPTRIWPVYWSCKKFTGPTIFSLT